MDKKIIVVLSNTIRLLQGLKCGWIEKHQKKPFQKTFFEVTLEGYKVLFF